MDANFQLKNAIRIGSLAKVKTLVRGNTEGLDLVAAMYLAAHGLSKGIMQVLVDEADVDLFAPPPPQGVHKSSQYELAEGEFQSNVLLTACRSASYEVVSYLLTSGFPSAIEKMAPSHLEALGFGSKAAFWAHFINECDVRGQSALHMLVILAAPVALLRLLIESGCNVDSLDKGDENVPRTALSFAAEQAQSSSAIVDLLLANGASTSEIPPSSASNILEVFRGEGSPLHVTSLSCGLRTHSLTSLLAAGAGIDEQDGDGRTALHAAVMVGCARASLVLLHEGADVKARDGDGRTVLDYLNLSMPHEIDPGLSNVIRNAFKR